VDAEYVKKSQPRARVMRSARVLYNVYAVLLLFAGDKKKVAINDFNFA
jgi:hypothetical protein